MRASSPNKSLIRAIVLALVGLTTTVGAGCDAGDDDGSDEGASDATGDGASDDGDADSGPKVDVPPLQEIEVTAEYEGTETGALGLGVFAECPAVGAPASFRRVTDPEFPASTTLVNIESGTWCVYAFVDLPPENPNLPGPEDPSGEVNGVVVESGETATVTVTITDPS